MNKKILGIIAGIATVGSAVFAAPAHAVKQDVDVTVTIQPSIYLRTFQTVNLQITQGDLGATKESDFNATPATDGTTKLTLTPAPTIGTGTSTTVKKNVAELFAVYSNSGKPVTVTITPIANNTSGPKATTLTNPADPGSEIILTGATVTGGTGTPTARVPVVGGVDLDLDVSGATAGVHSGAKLTVEALAQL
ncbi:hypothetical protein [Brunnivagina elsteri]|uniref:Uncharacterized protein n=1 Tax=Brunnivagina elsteri CCALA 953 TaxID=987040 RepID=A0A2A2TI77_9CYAN|nr:hypothetical protein [Calothrix elsteri]PAX53507.1 hypothetical protein CK510_13680 [Calothrix elsteri CCALA 953]